MARIAGVDIPREKRVVISLTYIFGIGKTTAQKICADANVSEDTRVKDLTNDELDRLRSIVDGIKVEGDLRRERALDIKRLQEMVTVPVVTYLFVDKKLRTMHALVKVLRNQFKVKNN